MRWSYLDEDFRSEEMLIFYHKATTFTLLYNELRGVSTLEQLRNTLAENAITSYSLNHDDEISSVVDSLRAVHRRRRLIVEDELENGFVFSVLLVGGDIRKPSVYVHIVDPWRSNGVALGYWVSWSLLRTSRNNARLSLYKWDVARLFRRHTMALYNCVATICNPETTYTSKDEEYGFP
jgi:hypothetical protein